MKPRLQSARMVLAALLLCIVAAASMSAQPSAAGKFIVSLIDVEGGQATLFVTPTGQSLLIDTGWPGHEGRDADRIVAAARQVGLTRLDYVLITHFHEDHVGGVPQLVARIPVGTFIDHGPNRELDHGPVDRDFAAYQQVLATGKYKRIVARPGDVLPITGLRATVVSADGNLLAGPLPGGGQANPFCAGTAPRPEDQTENGRSLGIQIVFGRLKLLDLGDLTWDKEMQLVCPANKLGTVDIAIVSHHGSALSSSPALVDAIHARVALMDNGERKGGNIAPLDTFAHAPGLETLWQLHASAEAGEVHNTAAAYIANPLGTDAGYSLTLTASPDGSFDLRNTRTGVTKHYPAR